MNHALARARGAREPVAHVEQHAGEKAGFGDADDGANEIEARGVVREHRGARRQPPGDQDGADPAARAELHQHQVAWHAAQHIREIEHARGHAEHRAREAQVAAHRQRGKADVDAIEEREQEQHEQKAEQATRDLAHDLALRDLAGRVGQRARCLGGLGRVRESARGGGDRLRGRGGRDMAHDGCLLQRSPPCLDGGVMKWARHRGRAPEVKARKVRNGSGRCAVGCGDFRRAAGATPAR